MELSHELDYANWFFGPFVDVQAALQYSGTLDIETEDGVEMLLNNTNGLPVSIHLDFYRKIPLRQCSVLTTKGELVWDCLAKLVYWKDNEGQVIEKNFQHKNDLFCRQLEHYFDCIENHVTPTVALEDGIEVMRIIEKAKNSDFHRKTFRL